MTDDLKEAIVLIAELIGTDLCQYDHNGGCQMHGYFSLQDGEKCPHESALLFLERHEPSPS
jgi:uncharacterized Fe-S cluster-containing MiaB family protein